MPGEVVLEWGVLRFTGTGDTSHEILFPKQGINVLNASVSEENLLTGNTQYRGGCSIKNDSVSESGMTISRVGSAVALYWMIIGLN